MNFHQATRSEALLNIFQAANHTIGYDTVRRIDTTIAETILQRFAKNGYVYVPDTIVKERMIHCSRDNRCHGSDIRCKEHLSLHTDDGMAEEPGSLHARLLNRHLFSAEARSECAT